MGRPEFKQTEFIQPEFKRITLHGQDAATFLQSQITADVKQLDNTYQATAIANLKGRIAFGIWVKKIDADEYEVVISKDCVDSLQAHLKKYGAFSKFTTSEPENIYPIVEDETPTFTSHAAESNPSYWSAVSIASGNYWITKSTQGMFQPQELRLHQRGGVHYDKGCYLGQEVIARIYFKAAPKAFLHRVAGVGNTPQAGSSLDKIQVVNAIPSDVDNSDEPRFEALVVARPEHIEQNEWHSLELPPALQQNIARED